MFIPIICFILLLVFNVIKTKKILNLYSFLLFYYLTAAIIGLYINNTSVMLRTSITFGGIGYLTFALFLFIYPWKKYNNLGRMRILAPSEAKLKNIAWPLIVANGLIILYYIFDVVQLLRGDINAERIRRNVEWAQGFSSEIQTRGDLVAAFIAQYISYTYFILIALYFYYLNKNNLLSKLCLITSLSIVVKHLVNIGRTGIILWILMYICCFIIFKNRLTRTNITNIRKYSFILFAVLIVLYMIVSGARFGEGRVGMYRTTSESLLDYYSQGYRNFDKFFSLGYKDYYYGKFHFPLLFGIAEKIGLGNYDNRMILDHIMEVQPETWNTFNTFIADLWIDYGPIGIFLFGTIYAIVVIKIIDKRNRLSLSAIFLILYMIQLPLIGLFSSTWKMPESNFVMLFIIGLFVYMRIEINTNTGTRSMRYMNRKNDEKNPYLNAL